MSFDQIYELFREGNYDLALNLLESMQNSIHKGEAIRRVGYNFMFHFGNLERGKELLEEALEIGINIENNQLISNTLTSLSLYYALCGDMQDSKRVLDEAEKIAGDNYQNLSYVNNIRGYTKYLLGDFEESLKYFDIGEKYAKRGEYVITAHFILYNRVKIYIHKKKYQKAKQDFQNVLEFTRKRDKEYRDLEHSSLLEFLALFQLQRIELALNNREVAQQYLAEMELLDLHGNKTLSQRHKLAKAIYLKSPPRIVEKAEAQKILTKIIDDKIYDIEVTLLANLHLCDLLLEEYRSYSEQEVLQEIVAIIDNMYETAQQHQYLLVITQVLILKSKFYVILGNTNNQNYCNNKPF